ncbi:hypothetical protein [Campylobacter novaezeelandiae]|uniref:hypothetical protein n=1 Tax=Campylobacter novaezeelandiae TaxID=2267891 RepID=UPI001419CB74|nr:hypothetical protein [Campylobacter novaezeelandiae]
MTTKKQRNLCIEELASRGVYAYENNGLVIVSIDEIDQSFILHDEEVVARAKMLENWEN